MAQKYCCKACDYVYNPQKGDLEGGIAPGVAFEDLPENWICPECGKKKSKSQYAKTRSSAAKLGRAVLRKKRILLREKG